jgi:hypothetical protein
MSAEKIIRDDVVRLFTESEDRASHDYVTGTGAERMFDDETSSLAIKALIALALSQPIQDNK